MGLDTLFHRSPTGSIVMPFLVALIANIIVFTPILTGLVKFYLDYKVWLVDTIRLTIAILPLAGTHENTQVKSQRYHFSDIATTALPLECLDFVNFCTACKKNNVHYISGDEHLAKSFLSIWSYKNTSIVLSIYLAICKNSW